MERHESRYGRTWLWAPLLLGLAFGAWAQDEGAGSGIRLRDLTSQNAVKLSAQEVKALASGASVQTVSDQGHRRTWKNSADGTLLASVAAGPGRPRGGSGKGTWHVPDNGTYCVQIEWENRSEQWCRFVYRTGDKYYGVKSDSDLAALAMEMKFF